MELDAQTFGECDTHFSFENHCISHFFCNLILFLFFQFLSLLFSGKWDVDYVKLDGCYADIIDMNKGYPEFGRLLNATGRPMVYSCSWPVYQEERGIMVGQIECD